MSTPRELLGIRDDLAKKVVERQLDRNEAVADLRAAVARHPELLDKLADDWADTEIDRGVKKFASRRNKAEAAAMARKLAELGMERPALDGSVVPISQEDPSYSVTLADYWGDLSERLASSRRLVKGFEDREEDHEVLLAAVDGNLGATREQAVDALKRMPEAKRKALRAAARNKLVAQREALFQQRYGDYGQAAQG